MSALRPHIRAARAYEAAWHEAATVARMSDRHGESETILCIAIQQREAHRRAAEIMEVELAAEYAQADPSPPQKVEPAPLHWHHAICAHRRTGRVNPCDMDCARDSAGWGKPQAIDTAGE